MADAQYGAVGNDAPQLDLDDDNQIKSTGGVNSLGDSAQMMLDPMSYKRPKILNAIDVVANVREGVLMPFKRRPIRWFDICYAEYLVIFSFLMFNVIFVAANMTNSMLANAHKGKTKKLGELFGTLIHWNLPLLLLPITRNSVITMILGPSFERLIHFHRWVGRWVLLLTVIHTVLMIRDWLTSDWDYFFDELLKLENVWGEIAGLVCLVMTVLSLDWVRRTLFEVFYKVHVVLAAPFFVFIGLHKHGKDIIPIIAIPLCLYVLDLIARLFLVLRPQTLTSLVKVSDTILRLECENRIWYKPGQYVFVYLPRIAPLQIHPFSLTSSPHEKTLTFHIKVYGRWGKRLLNLAESIEAGNAELPIIRFEGPYGTLSIPPLRRYKIVFFIAGGIGITPMFSILKELYLEQRSSGLFSKVVLVWSLRQMELFREFQSMFEQMKGFQFEFYIHSSATGDEKQMLIEQGEAIENNNNNNTNNNNTHHGLDSSNNNNIHMLKGRPILSDYFVDLAVFATKQQHRNIATLVCGPSELVSDCVNLSTKHSGCNVLFDLHTETFLL